MQEGACFLSGGVYEKDNSKNSARMPWIGRIRADFKDKGKCEIKSKSMVL